MSAFNAVWGQRPAEPTRATEIEVDVVGRRCVYVNCYRIAGGKPYGSEGLSSHQLKTTIGEVLDAFTEKQIRAALREAKATREYLAAYYASQKEEQHNDDEG